MVTASSWRWHSRSLMIHRSHKLILARIRLKSTPRGEVCNYWFIIIYLCPRHQRSEGSETKVKNKIATEWLLVVVVLGTRLKQQNTVDVEALDGNWNALKEEGIIIIIIIISSSSSSSSINLQRRQHHCQLDRHVAMTTKHSKQSLVTTTISGHAASLAMNYDVAHAPRIVNKTEHWRQITHTYVESNKYVS